MNVEELRSVRESVAQRLKEGQEPPWSWFTLMKLQEALDETIAGLSCGSMQQKESSQQSAEHPGTHLRLVDATCPQDTAQPHPGAPRLPMPM